MSITTTVTIDGAGRLVVPKSVREAMGLHAGSVLELAFEAGIVNLSVPSMMTERVDEDGRIFFTGPPDAPKLTDDELRKVLESVRP